jgi:long-chain acyl-CoA synthetase
VRVYAVRAPGAECATPDVVAHCRKELAAYKAPKQIVFIDASNVGKILRRELRELA